MKNQDGRVCFAVESTTLITQCKIPETGALMKESKQIPQCLDGWALHYSWFFQPGIISSNQTTEFKT